MDQILNMAVQQIYAAALDQSLWQVALDAISKAAGGQGAIILSISQAQPVHFFSESLNEANKTYLEEGWWQADTMRERGAALKLFNQVVTDRSLIGADRSRNDPFVNEFWHQAGIGGVAAFPAMTEAGDVYAVSVQRGRDGYFDDIETGRLAVIGPHVARALQISSQLSQASAANSFEAILQRMTAPALICDPAGKVICCNQSLENIQGTCFHIRRGKLAASIPAQQEGLDAALREAAGFGLAGSSQAILASQHSTVRAVARVFALPMHARSDVTALFAGKSFLLVSIVEMGTDHDSDARQPLMLLGLTRAEARIAMALAQGLAPNAISEQYEISVQTVRVHIRNIFGKLEITRQSQLVSLVNRLSVLS